MRITVIIDNISADKALSSEHGLSLFVEMNERKFFFDLGQTDLFLSNAKALDIDVESAEFAIISHGHFDHGGGLTTFFETNKNAKVLVHKKAFTTACYSERLDGKQYIGLASALSTNPRINLVEGITRIGEDIILFDNVTEQKLFSPANKTLYIKQGDCFINDNFRHELNAILLVGNRRILLAGCAHCGIVNIMNKAEEILGEKITDVFGGMHIMGVEDDDYITQLAKELKNRDCHYYTCHCTSVEGFEKLKRMLGEQIDYIGCGRVIEIN